MILNCIIIVVVFVPVLPVIYILKKGWSLLIRWREEKTIILTGLWTGARFQGSAASHYCCPVKEKWKYWYLIKPYCPMNITGKRLDRSFILKSTNVCLPLPIFDA